MIMPGLINSSMSSTWMGFIFVFNLIVGTGSLTLPIAFARSGWLLSLIVLILVAFISFVTVTFVIEALACANAVKTWQYFQTHIDNSGDDLTELLLPRRIESESILRFNHSNTSESEEQELPPTDHPIFSFYSLNIKFELGEIAKFFFNDVGRMVFYLCITIYLYGDLCIYCAVISKTLRDITCDSIESFVVLKIVTYTNFNASHNLTSLCWEDHTITRIDVYRLYLIGFVMIFGPFAAFSIQKTKYVQISTILYRLLAFSFMIALAIKILLSKGIQNFPPVANFFALPSLFGACIYSFMCHHSLPSLLELIKKKSKLQFILTYDFILITIFYIVIAITGILAFSHLQELYTLNFIPLINNDHSFSAQFLLVINYFLTLFPVFTLSTSFPIVAITLRNNLQNLFLDMTHFQSYSFFIRKILFPLCTILPPFVISFFTEDLTSLVTITGAYAGVGIQYLIPVFLVYFARRTCKELFGDGIINMFRSPFHNFGWLFFVLLWSATSVLLVTINLCLK